MQKQKKRRQDKCSMYHINSASRGFVQINCNSHNHCDQNVAISPVIDAKDAPVLEVCFHIPFLPRDSYAKRGICRRRVSVCVCLSHSGIVSKRLNLGSRKQHRTIWL